MPAKVLAWRGRRATGLARIFAKRRLRKSANDLLAACMAECPVDTGDLRDSHRIADGPTPYGFSVIATIEYAYFVHEGYTHTSARSIPPNPWMERAASQFVARA